MQKLEKESEKLTFAIIGTGALGGYYGARLLSAGEEVFFQIRTGCDDVLKNGLSIKSCRGDLFFPKIKAFPKTSQMPKADVIIVALKTTANGLLKEMLTPLLKENSLVILLQNGLGYEEKLAQELPNIAIAAGISYICAEKKGPGQIVHYDLGNLAFALLKPNEKATKLLQKVREAFLKAGVETAITENFLELRWKKLVWNVPYNGLAVVLKTTTDKINANPAARALCLDLMREVQIGAAAYGVKIEDSYLEKMLSLSDNMLPYAPSMRVDYDSQREMEIEGIYTNPIAAAAAKGVKLEKMQVLEQELLFCQSQYGK